MEDDSKDSVLNDAVDSIKSRCPKYKDEYCQMLVNHLSQGLSFQSFGGEIGVVRATMYNWVDSIPEFAEAKEIGEQKGLAKLEKLLLAKADGRTFKMGDKDFNPKNSDLGAIIFPLKTRFHKIYGEKQSLEVSSAPIDISYEKDES